jgi:hypothetical protein
MVTSIFASESCRSTWVSMVWCWCEGGDTVFGAKVFMVSTSVWVVSCFVRSVVATLKFVDSCEWSVCDRCVVWVVV